MRRLLGHRGFNLHPYCKGPYQRESSPLWGSISAYNLDSAVVLLVGKYLICLLPTGRSRVQLWLKNIFYFNSPCEATLREWAHRQYQDLEAELWAKPAEQLRGQWINGCCISK